MVRTDRRDAPVAARSAGRQWLVLGVISGVVVLLAVAGVLPVWPGLVHLVALPPLDLYADLRVLLTTTSGVLSFVLLGATVLVARILVLALLMGGLTRDRITLAAVFYGVLVVPFLLCAGFVYMAQTLLYARLFWAGLVAVAVLGLLLAPVPWAAAPARNALVRAWRAGPRVGVLLGYTAAVAGIGALAHQVPALTVPLVPVSAAATTLTIGALARPAPPRPLHRLGAAGLVLALVTTAWITTRGSGTGDPAPPREGSLLLMAGINSRSGSADMFGSDPGLLGYGCEQTYYFSYAAQGDGQPRGQSLCPIHTGAPYSEEHTQRPFDEQVAVFAEQVRDLPRPLVVAGHSHAAWVAWAAVATGAAPEVDALILVGAFPESTGGYRGAGEPGPDRPASELLRNLVPLGELLDFRLDLDAPAPRDVLGATSRPAEIFALPLPEHTRALNVPSSTDLPLKPSGWRMAVDHHACPIRTPHAYLPTHPAYYDAADRFLDGEPPPECAAAFDWAAPLSAPFGTPEVLVESPG